MTPLCSPLPAAEPTAHHGVHAELPHVRGLLAEDLAVVAAVLDTTGTRLARELRGCTLSEVAMRHGADPERVRLALLAAATSRIDRVAAEGRATPLRQVQMRRRAAARTTALMRRRIGGAPVGSRPRPTAA